MNDEEFERLKLKLEMIDLRVLVFGECLCDYCRKNEGSQMHEIIRRAWTVNSDEARRLSFQPPCCSLLCPDCHMNYAATREGEMRLIMFNIRLYDALGLDGLQVVRDAFYAIPRHLWSGIKFDFEFDKE